MGSTQPALHLFGDHVSDCDQYQILTDTRGISLGDRKIVVWIFPSWPRILFSLSCENPAPVHPVQGKRMLCMLHSYSLMGFGTAGPREAPQAPGQRRCPWPCWEVGKTQLTPTLGFRRATGLSVLMPPTLQGCPPAMVSCPAPRWPVHPQIGLQVEGGNVLLMVMEERVVHIICSLSLPWTKESLTVQSSTVLFLLPLFACRQQYIYWLSIDCEHSEQWLCIAEARSAVVCGPWLS